jgi:hypothetical protein
LQRIGVHRIPASRFVTIGRNAPLSEAGWREEATDLGRMESEMFFARGLDDPNQLESPREIDFCAHVFLGLQGAFARRDRDEIELICPSGPLARAAGICRSYMQDGRLLGSEDADFVHTGICLPVG